MSHPDSGSIDLYEMNVGVGEGRPSNSLIYPFTVKGGSLDSFKTVSTTEFNSGYSYGAVITGTYPLTSDISVDRFNTPYAAFESEFIQQRRRLLALKNTFNYYSVLNPQYQFNSDLGNKETQYCSLISIPSIFYGASLEKGTVNLKFYVTGTLVGELKDEKKNGSLVQVGPAGSNGSGSVAGVVLYKEGFIYLTGSWDLDPSHEEKYEPHPSAPTLTGALFNPAWIYFGTTGSTADPGTNVPSSSFDLKFDGVNEIPVLTMMAHAARGQLNSSNNPTYIQAGQDDKLIAATGSVYYKERSDIDIKNTIKSPYTEDPAQFEKQTYISKVAIYDEDKNLIGIAKLATPVRKRETDSYTFKMKVDF